MLLAYYVQPLLALLLLKVSGGLLQGLLRVLSPGLAGFCKKRAKTAGEISSGLFQLFV